MQPSVSRPHTEKHDWIYVRLTVVDGDRRLKPSSVCFDYVTFAQPPRLTSDQVEIILTNGDAEQRATAIVLPHAPEDTRIPIRLLR